MRKKQISVLTEKIREGNLTWLLKQGLKFTSIPLSSILNRQLSGPILGGIMITYACNMRCVMCDLWRRKGKELTTDEWKSVIDKFHELNVSGIGITGGEPLLRKDLITIIKHITQKKIPVSISSNGYYLSNKDKVKELFDVGLRSIAISLDSINPDIHNRIRGVDDAFSNAVKAFENIVELKNEYPRTSVTLSMVITGSNYGEVVNMVEFAEARGIDGVSFLPAQTMGIEHNIADREKKLKLGQHLLNDINKSIDKLIELKRDKKPIDNTIKYLKLLKYFYRNEKLPVPCYASNSSYYVDPMGFIYPCFAWMEKKKYIGNIYEKDLEEYWKSSEYRKVRMTIDKCRECYFSCQVELGLLYCMKCL
jgi:MoaA/NifB/PqqE/SkfB family radical SAM enzyme